jgi:NTE family protein
MDISLALGGGGAKGNSHIGVLRLLEHEGFRVRAIAGTSFGGLVACFYAAGFDPDEIERIFAEVDQSQLYTRVKDETSSLLGVTRVGEWLHASLSQRTFEDLRIPCAVTAVDLRTSNEVVIKHGSVRDAILATIALPGIFPSFLSEELELIDGGLLNPVPVAVARSLAPSLPVVAVALHTPLGKAPRSTPLPLLDGLPTPIAERLGNMRVARALDIFMRAIDIGGRQIAELRFQIEKPEVIIHPAVEDIGVLGAVDVHAIVRLGEDAARDSLPELRRATAWSAGLQRRLFRRPISVAQQGKGDSGGSR